MRSQELMLEEPAALLRGLESSRSLGEAPVNGFDLRGVPELATSQGCLGTTDAGEPRLSVALFH